MFRIWIPAFIVIVCVVSSCASPYMTSGQQTVTDQNGDTLRLTVMPDNLDIAAGGSVTVMIYTYNYDDEPIEGAAVTASATLGTVKDSQMTTDVNGVGVTSLTPGKEPGWCVVTATFKTLIAEAAVSFYDGSTGTNAPKP